MTHAVGVVRELREVSPPLDVGRGATGCSGVLPVTGDHSAFRSSHHYFMHVNDLQQVISAVLAVVSCR